MGSLITENETVESLSNNLTFACHFRYRGTAHAFSSIVKQNGITGLWKGWLPNVQRAALVNLGGQSGCSGLICRMMEVS